MRMRILFALISTLLLVVCAAGCVALPEYTVGYPPGNYPVVYENITTGAAEGFNIDVLKAIAADQGFSVRFVPVNAADAGDEIRNGTISMFVSGIPGAPVEGASSHPVYVSKTCVVTKKGSPITPDDVKAGAVSISCAKGEIAAAPLNLLYGAEKVEAMTEEKQIISYMTHPASLHGVAVGEAAVTLIDEYTVQADLNDWTNLRFAGYLDDCDMQTIIAVSMANPELEEKISSGLARLQSSPAWNELLLKYQLPVMKESYVVGIDTNHAPFSYLDEEGRNVGFDIDSMRWIANLYGFNVTFDDVPWSRNIQAIQSGEIDLWYAGMTITPERLQKVAFSDPYYVLGIGIGQRVDCSYTADDFTSGRLVVGVVDGTSTSQWLLSQFEGTPAVANLLYYGTQGEMMDNLAAGRIDAVVLNDAVMHSEEEAGVLKFIMRFDTQEGYGVAMQNGDIYLQSIINDGLRQLETSGKRAELLAKYHLV